MPKRKRIMVKIEEIKQQLEQASWEDRFHTIQLYKEDERKGVQKLLQQYERKWELYQKEKARTEQMWTFERKNEDCKWICGIDEAGRGPLAGPVVAAAVILPKDCDLLYINDSKQLSAKKREELYKEIWEISLTGVAKKYDLNYSKLVSACKEHNIPYPTSA